MNYQITGIKVSPKDSVYDEYITHYFMANFGAQSGAWWTKADAVALLRNPANKAFVGEGQDLIPVQVIEWQPPFLRTVRDGKQTNNLINLPRY